MRILPISTNRQNNNQTNFKAGFLFTPNVAEKIEKNLTDGTTLEQAIMYFARKLENFVNIDPDICEHPPVFKVSKGYFISDEGTPEGRELHDLNKRLVHNYHPWQCYPMSLTESMELTKGLKIKLQEIAEGMSQRPDTTIIANA